MNDEFERMLKEAIVAYFKVLSQHSLRENEGKHENSQSG
jgi:hypothetical protein